MPVATTNTGHATDFDEGSLDELYKPHWDALLTSWKTGEFRCEPLLRYRLLVLCELGLDPQLLQALPVPTCDTQWNLDRTIGPERLALTYRLASYHVWIYRLQKNLADLRRAMELYHEAIPGFPSEDPRKIYALIDLADLYRRDTSCAPSVRATHLEQASTLLQQAINDYIHGVTVDSADDTYLWAMDRLSLTMTERFNFSEPKNITFLEDAILYGRQLINMTSSNSIYRIRALSILGMALCIRYMHTGDLQSFHETVGCLEGALQVCPYRTFRVVIIAHLSVCLSARMERTKDYSGLDRLVEICEEAVNICPKHHIRRADSVSFLADAYIKGYHWKGDMNMLNKGVALSEQSLQDSPPGHPQRHQCLYLTSLGLAARVEKTGSRHDLKRAMEYAKESLDIMKIGHPERHIAHISLSKLHLHDFRLHGSEKALESSICQLSLAVTYTAGFARNRLSESVVLLRLIRAAIISPTIGLLQPLLTAYQQTLALLPKVVLVGMDVKSRLRDLEQTEQLAVAAAEVALTIGRPDVAIECLEEGRSVFWAQGLALRSSFEDLPEEMATELKTITSELEKFSYAGLDTASGDSKEISEDISVQMRRLGVQFDLLIDRARKLPGLDGFLSRLTFPTLCQAIGSNPVVLLLASSVACQAILITSSEIPLCVPLPGITVDRLAKVASLIKSENTWFRSRMGIAQECHERSFVRRDMLFEPDETMEGVLNDLWRHIVQPVINALGLEKQSGRDRPKVTWIPVGPFTFIPIHAAGVFDRDGGDCCSDYLVSSYCPTISALIKARSGIRRVSSKDAKVLVVAEPDAPGMMTLPNTMKEKEAIAHVVPPDAYIEAQNKEGALTMNDALLLLPRASILHLACHGQQDASNPLMSGFCLSDGKLTIAKIMQQNTPDAMFAFLSACETAKGDSTQTDQSIHLAAAMLFTGFKSIIGTMWEMGDADGPIVATSVYEMLFKDHELDLSVIPYALDDAVRKLRKIGISPHRWATFVHIGA